MSKLYINQDYNNPILVQDYFFDYHDDRYYHTSLVTCLLEKNQNVTIDIFNVKQVDIENNEGIIFYTHILEGKDSCDYQKKYFDTPDGIIQHEIFTIAEGNTAIQKGV